MMANHTEGAKPKGSDNCNPTSGQVISHRSASYEPESHSHLVATLNESQDVEVNQQQEHLKGKSVDAGAASSCDHEKLMHSCPQTSKDVQSKHQSGSTRSCTKRNCKALCPR